MTTNATDYGAAATLSLFVANSVSHMIPWLIVMFVIIICDLIFGLRRAAIMGEEMPFSRACRDTMGKMVTYFAFVCAVCTVNAAAGGTWNIDKWACLFICFIEGCSIVSNLLRPKGIVIDLRKILAFVIGKLTKSEAKDIEAVMTEEVKKSDKE